MNERRLTRLSQVQPQPIKWSWENRIPLGTVTFLEGDPGQSKSLLIYDISARLTRGEPMPNSQEGLQPAGVLLLQAEDGLCSTVKPQLQVAETDLDQIAVYYQNFFGKQPFLLPDDLSAVETAAAEVEAKLLIIGSINSSSPIPKFGEISPILPPKPLPSPVCRPLQRCNAGT